MKSQPRLMSENKTHNIMNTIKIMIIGLALLMVAGCEPKATPIEYGQQACDYCRMSIVDERYAAQLVSGKGKTFSFDAMECMINYKNENKDAHWHMELVTDYNQPRQLIPASEAIIVRSKNLPSPMGMYLTATGTEEEAKALVEENGGEIYSYPKLADGLENLPAL